MSRQRIAALAAGIALTLSAPLLGQTLTLEAAHEWHGGPEFTPGWTVTAITRADGSDATANSQTWTWEIVSSIGELERSLVGPYDTTDALPKKITAPRGSVASGERWCVRVSVGWRTYPEHCEAAPGTGADGGVDLTGVSNEVHEIHEEITVPSGSAAAASQAWGSAAWGQPALRGVAQEQSTGMTIGEAVAEIVAEIGTIGRGSHESLGSALSKLLERTLSQQKRSKNQRAILERIEAWLTAIEARLSQGEGQ